MTHNEWESGKELTVNNATKEQLKWMVEDRDKTIKRLYKELQEAQAFTQELISAFGRDLISDSRDNSNEEE